MFVRDPFDIAPHARRHTRASWSILVSGLLFAVACAFLLERSLQAVTQAQEAARRSESLLRAKAKSEVAARSKQNNPAMLERLRAQHQLQNMLRMSWSGLFEALESASQQVSGRATIVSLAPVKTQAEAAEVNITGLAVSNQVMVDYVRALQNDPHVREVELSMQQPALNAGVQVVRFQLSVLWRPGAGMSAPSAPGQSDGASEARQIK